MLSEKPWNGDAVMRLVFGLFVCLFAASLAASVRQFAQTGSGAQAKVLYPVAAVSFCFLAAALLVLGKPWRLETSIGWMVVLLACFCAGFLGGAWAQKIAGIPKPSIGQIIIGSLGFHGAGLFLIWRFLREKHITWTEAFGFANHRPHALFLGFTLALIVLPIGWGFQEVAALVIQHGLKVQPEEQEAVHVLRASSSWVPRAVFGAMVVFLAPVTEEMLFRGILYPFVKRLGYPRAAFWGVSLLFAAIHVNLVTFVPLLVLALALTLLYEKTDNLLAPITTHAMFNALNFAMLWGELAK